MPAVILILVLGVAATIVWVRVMSKEAEPTNSVHCAPPATTAGTATGTPTAPPTTLGKALEFNALDRTAPAPPADVLVRVVNASAKKGAARIVTASLRQLGFEQAAEPANDPLYGDTMTCQGQLRFGQQGTAAARTLSLLAPCLELVRDERKDATVDLAIGEDWDSIRPNSQARTALEQLTQWDAANPETKGGLQASGPQPDIDPDLLAAARDVRC